MFNLDQSISEWRRQMVANGIKTSEVLEELESHLRDDIEQQMKSGLTAQQAFGVAAQRIGQPSDLKKEFKKGNESIDARFLKLAGIACGVVALVFSLWTFPFLFHFETGLLAKMVGLIAVATLILSWKSNHKFLPVIRNRLIRTAIGLLSCVGGVVWILFFIINFLPNLMLHHSGQMLATSLWGWTVMSILGGVSNGLEKAAARPIRSATS